MPEALSLGYTLETTIPGWHRRGLEGLLHPGQAQALIRADQFEDDMEGFFVAVFARDERSIGKEARAARDAAEKSRVVNAAEERDREREAKRARERGEEGVRAVLKKSKKKGGRPSALFR